VLGDRDTARAKAEYWLYRGAATIAARLPKLARHGVAIGLAHALRRFEHRHTDAARRFLAQGMGHLSAPDQDALVLSAWRHLIEVAFEDAAFNRRVLGSAIHQHFETTMSPDVRRILDSKCGGFFVVPHVGMWEAMPALGVALGFQPAYVVSSPPRNRPLSAYAQLVREARGYRLIPRRGAVQDLARIVRAGGWVGLMLDQRVRSRRRSVVAPFFGRPALCERGIPILIRRLSCPVVFGACYRTDRPFFYRAVIDRVLEPEAFAAADDVAVTTAVNREIERLIRLAPDQYLWLHDRFLGAPEAEGEADLMDPRRS
jgi:KDO2-lipid IV(A) lauroyltransferase